MDQLARRVVDLAGALVIADNHFLSAAVGRLHPGPARLAAPLATDGYALAYDAQKLLDQFKREGEAPERDLVHCLAHCLFLHPYVGPSVDRRLWDLACDMAAERAVIDLCGPRDGERGAKASQAIGTVERDLGRRITAERAYRQLRQGRWAERVGAWAALFASDDHAGWYPDRQPATRQGASGNAAGAGRAPTAGARPATGRDPAPRPEPATGRAPTAGSGAADADPPSPADCAAGYGAALGAPASRRGEAACAPGARGAGREDAGEGAGAGRTPEHERSAQVGRPGERHSEPAVPDRCAPAPKGGGASAGTGTGSLESPVQAGSGAGSLDVLSEPSRDRLEREWREVARAVAVDLQTVSAKRARGIEGLIDVLGDAARPRADYARFLRRFATPGVATRLSEDEFDASFYTYGMALYGNMPLIEPLEQREERRVREFVVVIDTSGSVYHDEVRRFVDATFALLKETESFFSQVNLRILQCDAQVRTDDKVTDLAQLSQWGDAMTVVGGGGTDFRPAFAYIDALVEAGEFQDLGGVVYFTDGRGAYPEAMPAYRVAFVYGGDGAPLQDAPPWAVQIALGSDTM